MNTGSSKYPISYKLRKSQDGWKIVNIIINGVNLGLTFRNQFQALAISNNDDIESTLNNTFGRNMDIAHQMIMRNHNTQVAKNRASIGTRPEYGAPVMMPPVDRQGQMWANLSLAMGVASTGAAAFSGGKGG